MIQNPLDVDLEKISGDILKHDFFELFRCDKTVKKHLFDVKETSLVKSFHLLKLKYIVQVIHD